MPIWRQIRIPVLLTAVWWILCLAYVAQADAYPAGGACPELPDPVPTDVATVEFSNYVAVISCLKLDALVDEMDGQVTDAIDAQTVATNEVNTSVQGSTAAVEQLGARLVGNVGYDPADPELDYTTTEGWLPAALRRLDEVGRREDLVDVVDALTTEAAPAFVEVTNIEDAQVPPSGDPAGDDTDPVRVKFATNESQVEEASNAATSGLWFLAGLLLVASCAYALTRVVMPR